MTDNLHTLTDSDLLVYEQGNTYLLTPCSTGAFITTRATTLYEKRRVGRGDGDTSGSVRLCAGLRVNLYSVNARGGKCEIRWDCREMSFISPRCMSVVNKLCILLQHPKGN